jgi:REP element-mobilizing transposase RayT
MAYRSTNKTVYSAKYHLIWCPKYRRRVLVAAVKTWLAEVIGEVCAELLSTVGGAPLEVVRRSVDNQKLAA